MNVLKIEETADTPKVILDRGNNIFEISGNSYPEDATAFYAAVIQWVSEYAALPNETCEFVFSFDYFNSASYKSIYDIVTLLDGIPSAKVVWKYKTDDTDMKEIGEELSETVKIPFSLFSIA